MYLPLVFFVGEVAVCCWFSVGNSRTGHMRFICQYIRILRALRIIQYVSSWWRIHVVYILFIQLIFRGGTTVPAAGQLYEYQPGCRYYWFQGIWCLTWYISCCRRHIKPFFLPNDISITPRCPSWFLNPREIQILWSQTNETEKNETSLIKVGLYTLCASYIFYSGAGCGRYHIIIIRRAYTEQDHRYIFRQDKITQPFIHSFVCRWRGLMAVGSNVPRATRRATHMIGRL